MVRQKLFVRVYQQKSFILCRSECSIVSSKITGSCPNLPSFLFDSLLHFHLCKMKIRFLALLPDRIRSHSIVTIFLLSMLCYIICHHSPNEAGQFSCPCYSCYICLYTTHFHCFHFCSDSFYTTVCIGNDFCICPHLPLNDSL